MEENKIKKMKNEELVEELKKLSLSELKKEYRFAVIRNNKKDMKIIINEIKRRQI